MSDQRTLNQIITEESASLERSSNDFSNKFSAESSLTAGQMLKKARADAGLHIAALAVSLRVPVKRIEALENDQIDQLPDLVFVRALTSSICQALNVNPNPILDKLPKASAPLLNRDDKAINTPIGGSSTRKESFFLELFQSPLLLGVIFLGLATAAVFFWPKASVLLPSQITLPTVVLPETGNSQAKVVQVPNEGGIASNLTITSSLDQANTPQIATPVTSPAVSEAPAVSTIQSTTAAAAIDNNLVTFKATGETWVEVKNASGATVLKKLLKNGESVGATGVLPLTVIVGRADVTQVEVRGKPLDLLAIAKNNVARFEVN